MIGYWTDVVEGRKGGGVVRGFLWVLSLGFRAGRAVARWGARRQSVGIPVVSVGNVMVGGTGKTPLIDWLAGRLEGAVVVSRGYGGWLQNVWVEGEMDAGLCGDEPLLLARRGRRVIVGKDRYRSARMAEAVGAKVVLLDDGMQQRWLRSDFSIGVVHGKALFGNGHFLPRGYLRDSPKRLGEVDLVVVNYGNKDAEKVVKRYTRAPIVSMRPKAQGALAGKRVRVFCALGRPEGFVETVRGMGAEVVEVVVKPDHASFEGENLRSDDVDHLVCTEKDWVKLKNPTEKMVCISMDLAIIDGAKEMENFLDAVRQHIHNKVGERQ